MPTSKEQSEMEYTRARMGDANLSDQVKPGPTDSTSPHDPTEHALNLDDSITAEEALVFKEAGNQLYKSGEYAQSLEKYTQAARSAHSSDDARAVALANRAAAQLKLQRFRETASDATEALKLRPGYIKALKRRKEARIALKEYHGACEDAKELKESSSEIARLGMLAADKEKKDRDEAIESLKGLGNSILGNFGMTLDDLNMEKDPNTGSYSINMKK